MQQKLFQFFYHKKMELLDITEKELQKSRPNLKKLCIERNHPIADMP